MPHSWVAKWKQIKISYQCFQIIVINPCCSGDCKTAGCQIWRFQKRAYFSKTKLVPSVQLVLSACFGYGLLIGVYLLLPTCWNNVYKASADIILIFHSKYLDTNLRAIPKSGLRIGFTLHLIPCSLRVMPSTWWNMLCYICSF